MPAPAKPLLTLSTTAEPAGLPGSPMCTPEPSTYAFWPPIVRSCTVMVDEPVGAPPPALCSVADVVISPAWTMPPRLTFFTVLVAVATSFPSLPSACLATAETAPNELPWPRSAPAQDAAELAPWVESASGITDAVIAVPVGATVACWLVDAVDASARTGSLSWLTDGPPRTAMSVPRLPPAAPGQYRLEMAWARVGSESISA